METTSIIKVIEGLHREAKLLTALSEHLRLGKVREGPGRRRRSLRITQASVHLHLALPWNLPTDWMAECSCVSAARGIEFRLLTSAGIPCGATHLLPFER